MYRQLLAVCVDDGVSKLLGSVEHGRGRAGHQVVVEVIVGPHGHRVHGISYQRSSCCRPQQLHDLLGGVLEHVNLSPHGYPVHLHTKVDTTKFR